MRKYSEGHGNSPKNEEVLTFCSLARTSLNAQGSLMLPWECAENSDVADGVNEDVTFCTASNDVTIPGTVVREQALPRYSLKDPLPTADSCTVASIMYPTWKVSDFAITDAGSNHTLSFNIELQTGSQQATLPATVALESYTADWNQCVFAGPQPTAPSDCTFRYNSESKSLDLKTNWTCSDLDPTHP
jgi:hypothetical protein